MCLLCPVSLYIDSFGSHENFKDITDTGRRLRRQTGSKLLRGGGNEGRKKEEEEEERKEKDCLFFVSIRSHSSVRWPAPARSPTCSPCARERECARFSLFSHLFPLPILRFLSPSFFPSLSLSLSGPRGRQEAVTAWQRALLHINFFPSSAIPAPNAFAFHGHARRLFSAGTASRVASRFIIVFSFFSSYFYWTDLFFPLKREILISMEWFVISREVVERGRLFY